MTTLPFPSPPPLQVAHHELVVAVLSSGSSGNCTYIGDGRSGVLIDCGLSTKQVFQRLEAIGLGGAASVPIDAVLITHEHGDHVGAAGVMSRRLAKQRETPFFMTEGTRSALPANLTPESIRPVRPGVAFRVGTLTIEPVSVPHDTRDPVAYVVQSGGTRAAVITDLGRSTRLVEQTLSTLDVAVVEFNHDVQRLFDGSYPWPLKQRIRGPHGHLSNEQAAELIETGASDRLAHLVLAHLSAENNLPELAELAAAAALHRRGLRARVAVAKQHEALPPILTAAPPSATPRPPPRRRADPAVDVGQETLF
jgi:phosphoribosyl 1,2-cyclic phosphodiesterase